MASSSCSNRATDKSDSIHSTKDGLSSSFQQAVFLHDWWLIKAKNDFQVKRLAIAGYTSREWQRAVRLFSSAPIAKVYDVFTLETVDGVCVVLSGSINKQRTIENGFPFEVFSHFAFGFPSYWEQYAAKFLVEDSVSGLKNYTATSIHFSHSKKQASCSVECKTKQRSPASKTIGNIDSENLNSPSDAIKTIKTGNEVSALGKSATHLTGRVPKIISRKTTGRKGKKMPVCCLKTEISKTNPVPVVSGTEQSDCSELGRNVICMSDDKLQELVNANLIEEINDDRVKDCLQQTSSVKQGHKLTNRKAQGSMQNVLTSQSDSPNEWNIAVGEIETYSKEISSSRKKAKRKLAFDRHVTPCTQEEVKISIVSPESLSIKRSRSGRLLLPALEFWRNQMPIYDADRKLTGIQEGLPAAQVFLQLAFENRSLFILRLIVTSFNKHSIWVVDLSLIKSEESRGEFGLLFLACTVKVD